jgi:uncharacterized membrane protein
MYLIGIQISSWFTWSMLKLMRSPHSAYQFLLLVFILMLMVSIIQLGAFTMAMDKLGLSANSAMLLLICTLMASAIKPPLFSMRVEEPPEETRKMFSGLVFGRPLAFTGKTIVAVNVGGAIIPVGFSIYLINTHQLPLIQAALAIAAVTAVCRLFSRPVPGPGIGIPIFIAPISAALTALSLAPENSAPVASIGGAGTFDGIFFTGIVAVLLT